MEREGESHRCLPADFPVKGSTELNFLMDGLLRVSGIITLSLCLQSSRGIFSLYWQLPEMNLELEVSSKKETLRI